MRLSSKFKRGFAVFAAVLTAMSASVYYGTPHTLADSTQKELEDRLEEIEREKDELDDAISETEHDIELEEENQEYIDEQIETTEEYIRTLSELISNYDGQISDLEDQIALKEAEIDKTELLIADQQAEIEEGVKIYGSQLRAMYISGTDSVASVLMGATDFFDMLMKLELVKRVADYNDELIDNLLEIKDSYENNKLELENMISDLEASKQQVGNKKSEVESLREEWYLELDGLEELYSESKAEIERLEDMQQSYEDNRDELDEEAEKIEEEIQRIIREQSRQEYMGDLEPGTFLWPVPGYYHITSGYGSRWGTTHRGIDISGSGIDGAEITAANSGVVIFVNNGCTHDYGKRKSCGCGGGFGNYCIIDHGGGYATLYGHSKEIIVEEGDHVTTGDVIGYVGSTGYSTGAHLHFEVRVDGERLDPESFNLIKT